MDCHIRRGHSYLEDRLWWLLGSTPWKLQSSHLLSSNIFQKVLSHLRGTPTQSADVCRNVHSWGNPVKRSTRRKGLGSNSPVSSFFSLIQRATSSFHLANSKQCLLVYRLYMTLSDFIYFINFHKPFHNLYRAYAEACIIRRGMSQSLHKDSTSIRVELVELVEWLAHHIFDFLPFISFMTIVHILSININNILSYHIISHYFIFHNISYLSISSCNSQSAKRAIPIFNHLQDTNLFLKMETRSAESITVSSSSLAAQINLQYINSVRTSSASLPQASLR